MSSNFLSVLNDPLALGISILAGLLCLVVGIPMLLHGKHGALVDTPPVPAE